MTKRFFDIVIAATAMLIFCPLLAVIAMLVRINLGSPVLFSQIRPGRNAHAFRMYKFRTMSNAMDNRGKPLPDGQRLTSLGRFLRATSLDELPGLWNVLKGDMSLVGPRPLLMQYLPLYSTQQARRHEVRPGITGWAQVNGRNALTWEQKFEFDVWYIDNRSFLLDVKILWMTVRAVFARKGISSEGHATMPPFKGSR
jgi:lipopolysaccharide/colanic/teichoic acid biosynthesis glycosyltransferase